MSSSPVGLTRASLAVARLTIDRSLWSRRSVMLTALAAAPVVVAGVIRSGSFSIEVNGIAPATSKLFPLLASDFYLRFVVPLFGVFFGTSLLSEEVEHGSITFLFARPIRRGAVLLGKYVVYLCVAEILVLGALVSTFVVLRATGSGAGWETLVPYLSAAAAGLVAYGGVFAFMGASVPRPLVVGLAIVFGWEPAVLLFPGYLKRLTVAYYVQGLASEASTSTSVLSLAFFTAAALWLAVAVVEHREYVPR